MARGDLIAAAGDAVAGAGVGEGGAGGYNPRGDVDVEARGDGAGGGERAAVTGDGVTSLVDGEPFREGVAGFLEGVELVTAIFF